MTKSYRKPYHGIVRYSPLGMRQYKRLRAKQERARVRDAIENEQYDYAEVELAPWDDWNCPTDGKKRYMPEDKRLARK